MSEVVLTLPGKTEFVVISPVAIFSPSPFIKIFLHQMAIVLPGSPDVGDVGVMSVLPP